LRRAAYEFAKIAEIAKIGKPKTGQRTNADSGQNRQKIQGPFPAPEVKQF
jgi:hypothetical protein